MSLHFEFQLSSSIKSASNLMRFLYVVLSSEKFGRGATLIYYLCTAM